MVLVGSILVLAILYLTWDGVREASPREETELYRAATNAVSLELKYPATAHLPKLAEMKLMIGPSLSEARGWVDAQMNSERMIRVQFQVQAERASNGWSVSGVRFFGEGKDDVRRR
jgi:hypothetical protein